MTIPIIVASAALTPATGAQSITSITKADFIRQGYNIVNAYAERYRLTALQPCDGPGRLADYIWKRYADENGTIPLFPEHIAMRLSNGHVRVVERDSDSEGLMGAHPVADPIVHTIDSHPPIGSPAIDDDQLPGQSSNLPPSAVPRIENVYSPRGGPIFGPNDEELGHENPPPRWIIEMVTQARQRRQQTCGDAKAELASTVLELQKARNDLNSSVVESQKTIDRIRSIFGTPWDFKVLNAKEEIKKKVEGTPNEGMRESDSSYYDEENGNAFGTKYFKSSLGKRAREEDLDSETEVEASILYDGDDDKEATDPKKARLDEAGTSIRAPSSRRSSLKRSHDMDVDRSRYTHRVRFAEPISGPQLSSKVYHGQITTPESSPRSKASRRGASVLPPRRPLTRSTSRLLPAEDGGLYYVKYYPPRSKGSFQSQKSTPRRN